MYLREHQLWETESMFLYGLQGLLHISLMNNSGINKQTQ